MENRNKDVEGIRDSYITYTKIKEDYYYIYYKL